MRAAYIYEAILQDAEIRKYIHQKHLATFESFYEGKLIIIVNNFLITYFIIFKFIIGLRVIKRNLGLIKKKK